MLSRLRACKSFSDATTETDLGVWIASKPDFSLQCDKASAKVMHSLGLIKRTFTNLTKESFLIL